MTGRDITPDIGTRVSRGIVITDVRDRQNPLMQPMRDRAKVRHKADWFVSREGLIYLTDYDAGLYILQWDGA
jgi:hypothetical protein